MVKNLPSIAGDLGLIPGQGTKIPCAPGQLSPCSRAHALPHEKPKHHSEDPAQPIYIHTHIHTHTHTHTHICLLFVFICLFLNLY